MNRKRSPSQTPQKGGVSQYKTLFKVFFVWTGVLCLPLLTPFFSIAQTSKETTPPFILQGTVKLKNKPIDGVSLQLSKDGKQLSQLLTRKNGMYSFQMNKSNTDKEMEYILDITKEGTVKGVLRINTFSANEEFNYVPSVFHLEINLILPTASDSAIIHDFGKIKWDSELGAFGFDKEYVSTIEKNKFPVKTDSSQNPLAASGKIIEPIADSMKNAEVEARKRIDTTAIRQLADSENIRPPLELKDTIQKKAPPLPVVKENTTDKKEVAIGKKQSAKTETNSEETHLSETSNLHTETTISKKKRNEVAVLNTKEKSDKFSDLKNKKEFAANKNLQTSNNKQAINNNNQQTTTKKQQPANKKALTINNNSLETINNQSTANLSSVEPKPTTFDGTSIFSINNEKSKLLEEKGKMERKKTENLAKKYETSNILTSLLDVVEEYDTK